MRRACVGLLLLTGCPEEKPAPPAVDAAPPPLASPVATQAGAVATQAPIVDASPRVDAAVSKRFDPKYKCPTGLVHFYFEGDFCRVRCLSNKDCGKGERCNPIPYPYVVDGVTAGTARFCEGT